MKNFESSPRTEHEANKTQEIAIDSFQESEKYIREQFENGVRPIVTIPTKYEKYLKKGLRAHTTWIDGLDIIAATFDRKPFMADEDERIVVKIQDININQIEPRFTGEDKKFHGVVVLSGPISNKSIEVIHNPKKESSDNEVANIEENITPENKLINKLWKELDCVGDPYDFDDSSGQRLLKACKNYLEVRDSYEAAQALNVLSAMLYGSFLSGGKDKRIDKIINFSEEYVDGIESINRDLNLGK